MTEERGITPPVLGLSLLQVQGTLTKEGFRSPRSYSINLTLIVMLSILLPLSIYSTGTDAFRNLLFTFNLCLIRSPPISY